jgi:hypothetical protein
MAFKQASNILQATDETGPGVVNNSIHMDTDADDLAALNNENYDCINSACDSDNADDNDGSDSDNAGSIDSHGSDLSGFDSDDDTYDDVYAFKMESHIIQKKIANLKTFNLSNLSRTDLGICCTQGQFCCFRCAYNFGFNRTLSDAKLIERVASGLKPVGGIAKYKPNQNVRQQIIDAGLEILVDGVRNRWGAKMYYFARTDIANKFFSDFVNLSALQDIAGIILPDVQIRHHAADPSFYNELDNIVARGICYGYPFWSSIAIFFKENECNDADGISGPDDSDDDNSEDNDDSEDNDNDVDADNLGVLDNKNYNCVDSACDSDNANDDGHGSDSDNADDDDSQCGDQSGVDSDDDTYDDVYAFKMETPIIRQNLNYLEHYIDQKYFLTKNLGICCTPGQLCCSRCAYNIRFRGGSPHYCLDDALLIKRVASGLKPVGSIPVREPSETVRSQIIDAGLELLVDGLKNKWGMVVYYFARTDIADKFFSDFVNLATLREITGFDLPNIQIREHVINPAFYNESDFIVARGICYGYPIWSSIALYFLNNFL